MTRALRSGRPLAAAIVSCALGAAVQAQTLGGDFATDYSVHDLGSVAGLPTNYGGLTFLNSSTILIGGAANGSTGSLYTIGVTRDADQHITGFTGSAARYGTAIGEYNDGGVVFGPGGVLFTSRWPINQLGQTKPGSTDEDKIIDLAALGVAGSHSAINFVPAGFGGAGSVKLVSYSGGQWYSGALQADGSGTYDLVNLTAVDLDLNTGGIQNVPGGPEGFVYIGAANAAFGTDSMLISEYGAGSVGAYQVDANGDPLVATRRTFLSGLSGAEGATIDPLTGDFLFSTFGGSNRVVVVSGFVAPSVPEPSTWMTLALGLAAAGVVFRRRTTAAAR